MIHFMTRSKMHKKSGTGRSKKKMVNRHGQPVHCPVVSPSAVRRVVAHSIDTAQLYSFFFFFYSYSVQVDRTKNRVLYKLPEVFMTAEVWNVETATEDLDES